VSLLSRFIDVSVPLLLLSLEQLVCICVDVLPLTHLCVVEHNNNVVRLWLCTRAEAPR